MGKAKHRLAAIMFTDITGYTAMMTKNEAKALAMLEKNRAIHKSVIRHFGGKFLKEMGDGVLASFPAATNAVLCAGGIQKHATEANIPLRIGIHIGEVIFEEGDIFGEGVNMAARIEPLGTPGAILVSEDIQHNLINKEGIETDFLGKFELKDVTGARKLYEAKVSDSHLQGIRIRSTNEIRRQKKWLFSAAAVMVLMIAAWFSRSIFESGTTNTTQLSVLVLPFKDMETDQDVIPIGGAFADEVRGKLASFGKLRIRSRATSDIMAQKAWTAQEIAENLGVNCILEGSVVYNEDHMHVKISVIDALSDHVIHVIDQEAGIDLQLVQLTNQVCRQVLQSLDLDLGEADENMLDQIPTENVTAYQKYLEGKELLSNRFDLEKVRLSVDAFDEAIRLEPEYVQALAGKADALLWEVQLGYRKFNDIREEATKYALEAFRLDPNSPEANVAMALLYRWSKNLWEAEKFCQIALENGPENDLVLEELIRIYYVQGHFQNAFDAGIKLRDINPFSISATDVISAALFFTGREKEGLAAIDSFLTEFPGNVHLLWVKALFKVQQGDLEVAKNILLSRSVSNADKNFLVGYIHALQGNTDEAYEVLNFLLERNKKQHVPPSMIAAIYKGLGNMEKVYEWLPKEDHVYFLSWPFFDDLRDDPRLKDVFAFQKPVLG